MNMRMVSAMLFVCGAAWLTLASAGLGAAEEGVLLKHDDGSMESKRSTTGGGHAIRFERPAGGQWYLDQVQLFGARYGTDRPPDEDFFIYVTDEKMESFCKIAKPYKTFEKGPEKWVMIGLPPVKVPERFWVCVVFNPMRTKGVFVGIDKNGSESCSKDAVPESHSADIEKNENWMIRAHLSPKAEGAVLSLLSKEGREKQKESERAERDARLLNGAKSVVLKHDGGKMDAYHSYGGSTAETVAFEAPEGEHYVYGVAFYGSQYGGQHDAEAVCGDIYILDGDLRVLSRTSFPYSLLTYQKAWIDVPSLPTRVKAKFYVALHAHSEQYKGIYVGYDTHVTESHSSLGSVARRQFTTRPTPKKLEWMIRAKLTDRPVVY